LRPLFAKEVGAVEERKRMTPLGALLRGLVAGVVGSAAQSLFFAATKTITPSASTPAFDPPEPEQRHETSTETIARRFVEGLMQRELPSDAKPKAGQLVHYAFGAGWGGLYGLAAASAPVLATPPGAAAFGLGVWAASDNVLLPAFELAAWPQHYPAKNHAYAIAAHLVYGAATWLAFEAMRPRAERIERAERRAGRTERADEASGEDELPEVYPKGSVPPV
jgi:hypothetical protein